MSRQFPWLSDPNWNTMLDTGSGTSPSIAGLNNFRDREFINTRGPSIVLASNPKLLYALVPFYPFSGPIAQFSVGGQAAFDVYHTRNDGHYLTDAGWENSIGGPAIKVVKWYDQSGGGFDAEQTVTHQGTLGYDDRGWYLDVRDKFYTINAEVSINTIFGVIENVGGNRESAIFGSFNTNGDMFLYGANYYSFSFGQGFTAQVGYYWRDDEARKGPSSVIDNGNPPADWAAKHVICGQLTTANMNVDRIFVGSTGASPISSPAYLASRAVIAFDTSLDETTVRAPIQAALYDFYQVGA